MTSLLVASPSSLQRAASARSICRVDFDGVLTSSVAAQLPLHEMPTVIVDDAGDVFARVKARFAKMEDFREGPTKEWIPGTPLLAEHIPDDGPRFMNIRDWKPEPKPFIHVPVVTYRRGTKVQVITGPVEPTVPHTTAATHDGWVKWFGDYAKAKVTAIEAAKQKAMNMRAYFAKTDDDQEADYQARCDRAEAAGRPLPKRKKRRKPHDNWLCFVKDEQLVTMILASRFSEQKKKRIRRYKHTSRIPFAGRVYAPYTEEYEREDGSTAPAVRSWLGPITFKLFNSALPKHDIHHGNDKTIEYSADGYPRLFLLDSSHIVMDKTRRCAFIVDLDGWWPNLAALRKALRRFLPREFMPNSITYRGAEDGRGGVENPHLGWFLPPGSRVIKAATVKARQNYDQQLKLHEMVQKGIVSHLIELGADPSHTNIDKTKNLLSPGYSVEVCDDYFQTMDEWRSFLPTITPNLAEMKSRAAVYRAAKESEIEAKESLAIWNDGKAFRSLEIAAARRRQDPKFLAAVKQTKNQAFIDWLYDDESGVVVKRLLAIHPDSKALRSVLRAQRQYVVDLNLTPSALGEWCERGRDKEANKERLDDLGLQPLPPNATKEERKAHANLLKHWARQRTQENKKAINCGLIQEEIINRLEAGVPVVKAEVVKALVKSGTISRSVAYAHFDRVLQIVLQTARYQGKYLTSSSKSSNPVISHPDEVIESGPISHVQSRNSTVESTDPNDSVKPSPRPAQPVPPPWVADKDSLTRWQVACWISDEWAVAVAAWRSATHRRRRDDGVDLANDPGFRAMVLQRSSWGHHRLH